ncbi:MAG: glutathione S-transferase family protein [Sandaracinus sp.]
MRLHRLHYSPYARKVQMLLELVGIAHEVIEVPYGQREELARLTGGYVYVPVLETDEGQVITDSRRICEHLVARADARFLVPDGLEAVVWGLHDTVEGAIEDVLFRIASPAIRDSWPTAWERALYTLVKERKFGAGCIDAWAADRAGLIARGREMLEPTRRTLSARPFVLGDAPTLADLALYGQWAMLEAANDDTLAALSPVFVAHARRIEARRPTRG